jgi:hypothetical protein
MGAPFFIIGTERSGSNLLRVILDAHGELCVPHPPHILNLFGDLEASHGDLSDSHARAGLVDDVLALLATHIHPWPIEPDREALIAGASPPDLLGIFFGLYEQAREAAGKGRWGCKSTFVIHHADRILAHRPGARFIWLVRDPRDVAASSRKSVFSPCHPVRTARLWAEQQAEGLALEARLGTGVVHRVRYEDLLADPEGTVARVCSFLGEEPDPGMLRFFEAQGATTSAGLSESWKNTNKPIQTQNTGKWKAALRADEAEAVEHLAQEQMAALGYPLATPAAAGALPSPLVESLWEGWWRLGVEWRSLRHDANHWSRWGRTRLMRQLTREAARRSRR